MGRAGGLESSSQKIITGYKNLNSAAPRKDRERVLARQEFIEELSLWNETDRQIYHTRVPLPSE